MKLQQILYVGFLKTIWFNLRYLPLRKAIHFPVVLSRDVQVKYCHRGGVIFDDDISLHPGILKIGFGDLRHNFYCRSSIWIKGKLVIHGSGIHSFGNGLRLIIEKHGIVEIGNHFTASVNNRIRCDVHIKIGNDNMWSYDNVVMDTDGHQITDDSGTVTNRPKPIVFGDHVWLGCKNIVLKGSSIPEDCVVASGSVITGNHSERNCIITSNKKILKHNINWNRSQA